MIFQKLKMIRAAITPPLPQQITERRRIWILGHLLVILKFRYLLLVRQDLIIFNKAPPKRWTGTSQIMAITILASTQGIETLAKNSSSPLRWIRGPPLSLIYPPLTSNSSTLCPTTPSMIWSMSFQSSSMIPKWSLISGVILQRWRKNTQKINLTMTGWKQNWHSKENQKYAKTESILRKHWRH